MKIAVIGSGKFGRVLAQILGENGHEVIIYSRRQAEVNSINKYKKSSSGFKFNNTSDIWATNEVADLSSAVYILISVSSKDFREVMGSVVPGMSSQVFVSCVKGFEESTGKLMTEILNSDFGVSEDRLVVLSGPNLSKELSNFELTGTVLAGKNNDILHELAAVLKNNYFIPYLNNDMNGVEMGGALKNIYAIVSGYFHEKGVGDNTIGLLLTKCLEEMRLFSQAKGANSSTFLGLSGVGDFFSTALSKDSRNYRFGALLAKNFSVEEALKEVNDTVEGYQTSLIVFEEAKKINLNLQILNFLISAYESPKSLEEAKEIFRSKLIEEDIKLKG